jgi:hypothetical protein
MLMDLRQYPVANGNEFFFQFISLTGMAIQSHMSFLYLLRLFGCTFWIISPMVLKRKECR